jgi:hypothetical protein
LERLGNLQELLVIFRHWISHVLGFEQHNVRMVKSLAAILSELRESESSVTPSALLNGMKDVISLRYEMI